MAAKTRGLQNGIITKLAYGEAHTYLSTGKINQDRLEVSTVRKKL